MSVTLERDQAQSGFTLLELLVVLVLLSIFMTMGFGLWAQSADERRIEQEARRVVALMNWARDKSMLGGQDIAISFSQDGYLFLREEATAVGQLEWLPITDDAQLRPRDISTQRISIGLYINEARVPLHAGQTHYEPMLIMTMDGLVTPFVLRIGRDTALDPSYSIISLGDGRLRLEQAAP